MKAGPDSVKLAVESSKLSVLNISPIFHRGCAPLVATADFAIDNDICSSLSND